MTVAGPAEVKGVDNFGQRIKRRGVGIGHDEVNAAPQFLLGGEAAGGLDDQVAGLLLVSLKAALRLRIEGRDLGDVGSDARVFLDKLDGDDGLLGGLRALCLDDERLVGGTDGLGNCGNIGDARTGLLRDFGIQCLVGRLPREGLGREALRVVGVGIGSCG